MRNILLSILCVFSLLSYGQLEDNRGYKVKVGDMAPVFNMKLVNGETFDLAKQKNKIVMLQFTASWCAVCRKEMPFIESDIWQKHKANPDFVLVAIDRDEPLATVKEFVESTHISYPIGLDPKSKLFTLYALPEAGITRNVIIDRDGRIVKLTRLYNQNEFTQMTQMIDNLLK
jgi:peroxiredoxin